jgi:hypothetical protein
MEHIAPVGPVLREVQRVLRPGGHFLFTTPDPRLYSRDGYFWRQMLGPIGCDRIGRRIADRENTMYQHLSVLDSDTWRAELEWAGLKQVARSTYLPLSVAQSLTRFSGAVQQPILRRYAWRLSGQARAVSRLTAATERDWIDRCWTVLAPLLRVRPEEEQCGQLFLATKN